MSRTYHDHPTVRMYGYGNKPGRGKALKRAYHKAVRRAWKGTGKTRAVASMATELGYAKQTRAELHHGQHGRHLF